MPRQPKPIPRSKLLHECPAENYQKLSKNYDKEYSDACEDYTKADNDLTNTIEQRKKFLSSIQWTLTEFISKQLQHEHAMRAAKEKMYTISEQKQKELESLMHEYIKKEKAEKRLKNKAQNEDRMAAALDYFQKAQSPQPTSNNWLECCPKPLTRATKSPKARRIEKKF